MFLLDGFDELLLEGRVSGGLQEFLSQVDQFQKYTHHRFLITGRPLALYGIERLISQTKSLARVEIQPMDDLTQQTWLEKWESKVGIDESNNFQDFLTYCPDEIRNNLAKEPLILYLLARMHREQDISAEMFADAEGIKAKIRIYDASIEWVLKKQRQDENLRLAGLEYEDLREFLTEVALCVVQSGNESAKVTMVEARLKDSHTPIAEFIKITKKQTSLENVKEDKILNNLLTTFYIKPASEKIGGSMEFVHKSFSEFLFAERLLRSFIDWTDKKTNGRREKDSVTTEEMDKQIYDLLGYGDLTPEIVEYLMGLLVDDPKFTSQCWVRLFQRLEDFYLNWSEGKFIDVPADQGNLPQFKKEQLRKQLPDQENHLGLRQVDLYTGQNVLILLLELHSLAKKYNELEEKISFYPCGQNDTEKFDLNRLRKIINYSECLEIWGKTTLRFFLYDANLSDANLSGANLSGANLSGANLSDAYLINANLSDAYLSNANLSNANLSNANLSDADLSNADLSGADLSDAYLSNANLINANLSGVDLSNANLSNANLSDADLSNADLSGADLSDAYLSNANLSNANLSDADLSNANLTDVLNLVTLKK